MQVANDITHGGDARKVTVLNETLTAILAQTREKQKHRKMFDIDGRVVDAPHPGYYTAARIQVEGKSGQKHQLRLLPMSGTVYSARLVKTTERVMLRVPVHALERKLTGAERDSVTIDPLTGGATVAVFVERPVVREVWTKVAG